MIHPPLPHTVDPTPLGLTPTHRLTAALTCTKRFGLFLRSKAGQGVVDEFRHWQARLGFEYKEV